MVDRATYKSDVGMDLRALWQEFVAGESPAEGLICSIPFPLVQPGMDCNFHLAERIIIVIVIAFTLLFSYIPVTSM